MIPKITTLEVDTFKIEPFKSALCHVSHDTTGATDCVLLCDDHSYFEQLQSNAQQNRWWRQADLLTATNASDAYHTGHCRLFSDWRVAVDHLE